MTRGKTPSTSPMISTPDILSYALAYSLYPKGLDPRVKELS
jgi:hypothetical protein